MGDKTDKILIVDDEPSIREVLSRWLKKEGYDYRTAANVDEACKALEKESFSLILLDLMMPEKSGEALLHIVKERYPDIAIVMATAIDDRSTALDLLRSGAYGYVIKPLDQTDVMVNVTSALQRREAILLARDYQKCLEEEVLVRTAEIRCREEEIVLRLAWASESHDKATGDHIRRIGQYSAVLAEALRWESSKVEDIRIAATMHDIGKIGIADGVLLKTSSLTPEEFQVVKAHTEIGASILNNSDIPLLQMAREIALCHHEKWDGSGYPQGLAGERIPESARIVAVVDVYDSLTQTRAYRPDLSEEEALAIMNEGREKHFDPRIFNCFIQLIPQIRRIGESLAQESQHPRVGEGSVPATEALFPTLNLEPFSGEKALVVDDASQVLDVLGRFLKARGWVFVGASNAQEAITKFEKERPRVVLLDITLPDRNGLEVLQEIRRIDPDIGVIMITGAEDGLLRSKALEMGAFDFLTKPFDFDQLESVLRANFESASSRELTAN